MAVDFTKHRETHFRETKSFVDRCKLSQDLIDQYPYCIPAIVERASDEKRISRIDKSQFLVPQEMTFGTFFATIRKRIFHINISGGVVRMGNVGLWMYAGKTPITTPSSRMSEIYHYYKDNDGFLYIQYKGDNVFG